MISKIKSKYWQRTHQYGFRIPKNIQEAKEIDTENNNRLWQDAIEDEMRKVMKTKTFELIEHDVGKLVAYQEITLHSVFDIKLGEGFRRKARLVADGHKT